MLKPLRPRPRFRIAMGILGAVGLASVLHVAFTGQLPLWHRVNIWSIAIYEGDTPFTLEKTSDGPALTAIDVDDVPAEFVADPFLFTHEGAWWMFFEVMNEDTKQGDIGVAKHRPDGSWEYAHIVLDEPFHLSYPQVFSWQGETYMVPESSAQGEVRLYRAASFPDEWEYVRTLVQEEQVADATLFRHEKGWWMFAGASHTHDRLRLYFADQLLGPWLEHPDSPLIESNPQVARPGGRVIQWAGQLYRLGQDCTPNYGHRLRAFAIEELTRSTYREQLSEVLLEPGTLAWNRAGMHHADVHQSANGRWMAAVDGHSKRWKLKFGLPY